MNYRKMKTSTAENYSFFFSGGLDTEDRIVKELELLSGYISAPPFNRRVFVNRHLRLEKIQWIGFDMDYTLLRYREELFEDLIYRKALKYLIQLGYPESIAGFKYDPNRAIRGLIIDKYMGNILHLDRHRHVSEGYHGHRKLTKEERRKLYRSETLSISSATLPGGKVDVNGDKRRYRIIDAIFGVPEACLYMDLIHWAEENLTQPDYLQIYNDVRKAIDLAHANGDIHQTVLDEFSKYTIEDPQVSFLLQRFRRAGKKLFLLTNSDWDYTATAMDRLLTPYLSSSYRDWRELFDLIIVRAKKPDFFSVQDRPFEVLSPTGQVIDRKEKLSGGEKFLRGGNKKAIESIIGEIGDHILYVGDHIYGDILKTKKSSAWRTMLIIEELERELILWREIYDLWQLWENLEERRTLLDSAYRDQSLLLEYLQNTKALQSGDSSNGMATLKEQAVASAIRRAQGQLHHIKKELENVIARSRKLLQEINYHFNPYWGMLFREGHQYSFLGEQVRSFACIYSSRVTNLLYYAPNQSFHPPLPLLPHEMVDPTQM